MDGTSPSKCFEEDAGVLKSGMVVAAFAPVKSKKTYYAVLGERALELHDSEKSYQKKKPAKHLMDLAVAFNVHNDHLDPKLKSCVCLMGPDETLCMRGESAKENTEWYDAILSAIVPSRALRLGRPVLMSEFFESAWDVDIVVTPKLKKPVAPNETLPSMCERQAGLGPGPRRLCFYPHTIVLCKRRIEPTLVGCPPSGCPPFHMDNFIELPRMFVAFYGSQERYFLIKMGRGSPTGACELWAQCESDEVANSVHVKLNYIIERETEKKKKMNGGVVANALPVLRTHHRDRSHTQPLHMRTNPNGLSEAVPMADASESSIVVPAPPYTSARDRRAALRDCKALIDSFEEENNRNQQPSAARGGIAASSLKPRGSLGNPAAFQLELLGRLDRPRGSVHSLGTPSMLAADRRMCSPAQSTSLIGRKPSAAGSLSARSQTVSLGSKGAQQENQNLTWSVFPPQNRRASATSSIKEEPSSYQEMTVEPSTSSAKSAFLSKTPVASSSNTEETEDSGGTLRLDNGSIREDNQSTRSSQRSLIIAEATIEQRSKDCSSSDNEGSGSLGGVSAVSGPSTTSADTGDDSYAPMDAADWNYGSNSHLIVPPQYERYNLEEVRSYVSDSSDSCYSSMAANCIANASQPNPTPRAYSFGGRGNLQPASLSVASPVDNGVHLNDAVASLVLPFGDQRTRAFSLGHKSFGPPPMNPFRKISHTHSNRQQRHSQTSTSGASLASSAASSLGPSASHSTNHLISAGEKEDYTRNRSGSFGSGSGRSTPYNRRGGATGGHSAAGPTGNEHHVEMDFSVLGRTGSGSLASVESPSRSRTSSFGCGRKDDIFNGYQLDIEGGELTPSQKVLQQAQQDSLDECGDYVITEAPNFQTQLAMAELQQQQQLQLQQQQMLQMQGGYLSPSEPFKALDIRTSQVIETIEENTSEKSSRSSSVASLVDPDEDDEYTMMDLGPTMMCPVPEEKEPVLEDDEETTPTKGDRKPDLGQHIELPEESATRPDRSSSSPVHERDSLKAAPLGLPKRSSVPSMLSNNDAARDDSSLNYATLQMHDDASKTGSVPTESHLSATHTRTRSKSGIIFTKDNPSPRTSTDYASLKPLP